MELKVTFTSVFDVGKNEHYFPISCKNYALIWKIMLGFAKLMNCGGGIGIRYSDL